MAKTIIEKEIERRENLLIDKSEKEEMIVELREELKTLEAEVASIDKETLEREIEELETYLPKSEPEEAVAETAENRPPYVV